MGPQIIGVGSNTKLGEAGREKIGGNYTFVVTRTDDLLLGVLRFPLDHFIGSVKRKKRGFGRNQPTIRWYCPFRASGVEENGFLPDLSISHQNMYFIGPREHVELYYRSSVPEELLDPRFQTGRLRTSAGLRNDHIYRIPRTAFTSTFFSGRGKHLDRSLDTFVEENVIAEEGKSKFEEIKIKRLSDLLYEIYHCYKINRIDRIFRANLYTSV